MADADNKSPSDGERRLPIGLKREPCEGARALKQKWAYDFYNNKGGTEDINHIMMAQYALCTWKEDEKGFDLMKDRKKADYSELWTGVYQYAGIYSVFQGVIYQGVTTMASMLTCGFYKIPVLLSVLASAATILGIYWKLSKVQDLTESMEWDKYAQKTLLDHIEEGYKYDVKDFSAEEIENRLSARNHYPGYMIARREALFKARLLQWAVLVFLATFSALFAYLDYIVMCRGYT